MKTETLGPPRRGGSRIRPPRPEAEPQTKDETPRRRTRPGKDGE
ncbi:MAG TPA: hypothetical protein VF188_08255 [Longimicrobiales bacterium]